MIESILQTFREIVINFSWKRLIHLIVIIVSCVLAFERYTAFFHLSKVDKIINIVAKIDAVYEKSDQPTVKEFCNQLLDQLRVDMQNKPLLKFFLEAKPVKIFLPLWPWIIFSLFFIRPIINKESNSWAGLVGIFFCGFVAIIVGVFLPKNGFLFETIIYPIVFFIMCVFL